LTATTTLTAKLSTENGDSVTVFDSASHAAKDFLVKHLPEWMIPEGWKPEEEFVSVGVLMDPSLLRAFTPMSPSARASGGLEPEAEPAPSKEASHEAR
jgi:hypothetical protein